MELASFALERLDTLGRAHGAVAELLPERALQVAAAADRRLAAGRGGPLTGIPYGVKDLFAVDGATTRWGSLAYPSLTASRSAALIERLDAAGAVLVAQLSLMELAGAGGYRYASASATGICRNPWNPDRWAGGSSSGAAAAVALGAVPFAIGSETGGSILIPSAFCGVTGLRPSFGAVSRRGGLVVAWSLDKFGPIARSAADCGLVLDAIAGSDAEDASTFGMRRRRIPARALRIGVLPVPGEDYPATRSVFDEACAVLGDAGFAVSEAPLPDHDYRLLYERIHAGETALAMESFVRGSDVDRVIDATQRDGLIAYRRPPAADYIRASTERASATADFRRLFESLDAVVSPTLLSEATMLDEDLRDWPARRRHYAVIGAVTGVPGISVPMGVGEDGLPLGLSVMSDVWGDRIALEVGGIFQARTDWHLRTPPLLRPAKP